MDVKRHREGVTDSVNTTMDAVDGDVLCEDGLILRTCGHGIRHPVGHIHRGDISEADQQTRHETDAGGVIWKRNSPCCDGACCQRWMLETAARLVRC